MTSKHMRDRARKLRNHLTPPEARLWYFLRDLRKTHGLHFRRQVIIDRYIVDFCCYKAKLVIELDGYSHDGDKAQAADIQRDQGLSRLGYMVKRYSNSEAVSETEGMASEILDIALKRLAMMVAS